jgi:hypothetical protein
MVGVNHPLFCVRYFSVDFLFFVQENVEKNASFKRQKTEQFLKFLNRSANWLHIV